MFYDRFLDLCKRKNLKPTAVIEELGFSSGNMSRWKNGKVPRGDSLKRVAEYFNVSTDYLLGNDTSTVKDPATDDQIKFALFGTTDIDDELYEDIKRLAKMHMELRSEKKNK